LALAPSSGVPRKGALGIDVSRFNRQINWQDVADSGVKFAFVEASRGSGGDCTVKPRRCGADPYYALNYQEARAAGIRVGAYHRAFTNGGSRRDASEDAVTEADLFVAQVGRLHHGDLLPALDVETPFDGLDAERLRSWVRVWLRRVRRKLGAKPIVYTNAPAWRATGDTARFARAGHRLWVANWNVSEPSVPADHWDGQGWSIWQFTNSGRVRGIQRRVDEDRLGVGFGKVSVP
jgi:lysozyme